MTPICQLTVVLQESRDCALLLQDLYLVGLESGEIVKCNTAISSKYYSSYKCAALLPVQLSPSDSMPYTACALVEVVSAHTLCGMSEIAASQVVTRAQEPPHAGVYRAVEPAAHAHVPVMRR